MGDRLPEVTQKPPQLHGSPMDARKVGDERVDALIVTAVKDEWDAVLAVDTGADPASQWERRVGPTGLEVALRDFSTARGTLRIAVTQALGMGGAMRSSRRRRSSTPMRCSASRCAAYVLAAGVRSTWAT